MTFSATLRVAVEIQATNEQHAQQILNEMGYKFTHPDTDETLSAVVVDSEIARKR